MALVTVIGAGVAGLCSAFALRRAGHRVRVVAERDARQTVSAVAAALWHPLLVEASPRVALWAADSRREMMQLASLDPSAGIDVLTLYEVGPASGEPWWGRAIGGLEFIEHRFPGTAPGVCAWKTVAPRIEPRAAIRWLESKIGVDIEWRSIASLDDEPGDVVVNCAGLGAGPLAGDPAVSGLLGQVVITEPGAIDMTTAITHTKPDGSVLYVVPRRQDVVLGGLAKPWPIDMPTPEPDVDATREIVERARQAGFDVGHVIRAATGIRPARPTVRLERVGRIVHNYGHGGSGWTLGFGCAAEVAALVGS